MVPKTEKIIKLLALVMVIVMMVSYFTLSTLFPGNSLLINGAVAVALFFLCFGSFTFLALDKVRNDGMKYNRTFMVIKTIKMFIAILGAIVFVLFNRSIAVPFLVTFAIIYVIYTVFEAIALTKLNKGLTK